MALEIIDNGLVRGEHVEFVPFLDSDHAGKIRPFAVRALTDDTWLGKVAWYSPWRQYCFFPAASTLCSTGCLRDIAEFCQMQTDGHAKKIERRESGDRINGHVPDAVGGNCTACGAALLCFGGLGCAASESAAATSLCQHVPCPGKPR